MNDPISGLEYAVREIAKNGRDPDWWRARAVFRVDGPFQRRVEAFRNRGINVVEADWDVLVVLDGCRNDLFAETVDTEEYDSYRRVYSRASQTEEWLRVSFPDTYGEFVYVGGNPMVSLHKPEVWHRLYESWRDGFDESLNTIAAPSVTEDALEARDEYPNKRLIVHYMQPHYPFVGYPELQFSKFDEFHELGVQLDGDDRANSVWDALGKGLVEYDEVWEGYRANLEYVVDEVDRLLEELPGERIVVTSDHGNLLGERLWPIPLREYGHPPGLRTSGLIEVPWAVREGDDRPTVTTGPIESRSEAESDDLEDRLSALGYA